MFQCSSVVGFSTCRLKAPANEETLVPEVFIRCANEETFARANVINVITEQNNNVKNPNWPKANQISWLFSNAAEKLNQGPPASNSTSGQNGA